MCSWPASDSAEVDVFVARVRQRFGVELPADYRKTPARPDALATGVVCRKYAVCGSRLGPGTAVKADSVVIPAGTTVTIGVTRDSNVELDETFGVSIGTGPPGVTVSDGQAQGTILDDDDLELPPCLKRYD